MDIPHNNQRIAAIFRAMADLLASQRANPYRVRAYRRAADQLLAMEEDLAAIAQRHALEDIEGIGRELSEKIEEFLRTGTIQAYEALKTPLPDHVRTWSKLPGLSDSLVAFLYARLNITTLNDLEQLVRSHMLRTVPGFAGSEERLLDAIAGLRQQAQARKDGVP